MFKVAVVGTGLIATRKHLPAWQRSDKAELVAVCELNPEQGEKIKKEFGIPKAYTDLGELLEAEKPDIVDICTPPKSHAPLAIQALRGGAHCLIEKPMAIDTDECDKIIAAAEENDRQVCVLHSDLFYPGFMRAYDMYQSGALGEFRGMSIFLSTPVDYITAKPDHWAHKLPGGVIGETGPHIVYLTLAFMNPIHDVQVLGTKQNPEFGWSPYEDYRINLTGKEGVATTILTYSTNQWAAECCLWGTEGMIKVDLETQKVIKHERTDLSVKGMGKSAISEVGQTIASVNRTGASVLTGGFKSTHELLIQRLCENLAAGKPVPVSAQEGREAVRVVKLLADQLDGVKV